MRWPGGRVPAVLLLLLGSTLAAPAAVLTTLSQLSKPPAGWTQLHEPPSPDTILRLRVSLADGGSNSNAGHDVLESKLLAISSPDHADYGKHLSRRELQALTSPPPEASRAVVQWLQAGGVAPADIKHGDQAITFAVKLADAEKLLHTTFAAYRGPDSASGRPAIRTLRYAVPAHVAPYVSSVQPTTRFSTIRATHTMRMPKSALQRIDQRKGKRAANNSEEAGQEPRYDCNREITPDCLRKLYNMEDFTPVPHPRNKLFISGYLNEYANQEDLTAFLTKFAPDYKDNRFRFIGLSNATNPQDRPPTDSGEASLDIDYAIGLSNANTTFIGTKGDGPLIPDLSAPENKGENTEPYLDQLEYLLQLPDDELPSVLSTSYGENEQEIPVDYIRTVCRGFAKLGARGVSVIFSSGDDGVGSACMTNDGRNATRFNPIFPATCPYVTSVGATWHVSPEQAVPFSSGGFSDIWPRPKYQQRVVAEYLDTQLPAGRYAGLYNASGRGFPDVAAQGWNFHIIDKKQEGLIGGTSASAPTFAAVVYNLNALRLAVGKPPLGFLNPFLYGAGRGGLTDIVHGGSTGCTGRDHHSGLKAPLVPYASWNATPGWDPVTGLGTPDFGKLAGLVLKR
ncbi:vesicle formation at the endoplasmic reticulum [Ascosphaera acerosa]|nr:vesicle formation at the endoplasmic reticulum [Ascosphaera acerosa]